MNVKMFFADHILSVDSRIGAESAMCALLVERADWNDPRMPGGARVMAALRMVEGAPFDGAEGRSMLEGSDAFDPRALRAAAIDAAATMGADGERRAWTLLEVELDDGEALPGLMGLLEYAGSDLGLLRFDVDGETIWPRVEVDGDE